VATTVTVPVPHFFTESHRLQLDDLLYEICQELQLSPFRHNQAEERYKAVASALESEGSPFHNFHPRIYPQGSMRLGTTVKPIEGPHDLDFVCELNIWHNGVAPLALLDGLFDFLRQYGPYRDMVSRKNRCVRITYADEFYMDVLPACRDLKAGGSCIQVPDRALRDWTPSNPIGYARWFDDRSRLDEKWLAAKAEPVPPQQAVDEKTALQLAVQLIKRWRDLYFNDPNLAPISVVLTTLGGCFYKGEGSVSAALSSILDAVVEAVAFAHLQGKRLLVLNPSNPAEDLSERWENSEAYRAFKLGIHQLRDDWKAILHSTSGIHQALEGLFGEPVRRALIKQAHRLQEARKRSDLGIRSTGIISSLASGTMPIPSNTFHGDR